ncbi:hypothetical protein HYV50_03250 [Candidatus Pacearchaeota archaeon]|nr:hypothetical protein [Candidatus Pacearchaeota archaeon]
MGLTKYLSGVGRKVAIVGAGLAAVFYGGNARAVDRNIRPNWTFQEINNYLNSGTCAGMSYPGGEACPVAGDTIIFNGNGDGSEGVYTPPSGPPVQSYELRTNNVNITHNNARFQGGDANSQVLFRTFSEGNTISGCSFYARDNSSQYGIFAEEGFKPENPVILTSNNFYNFDVSISFGHISTNGINNVAGFRVDGNYIENTVIGTFFSEKPEPTNNTIIYGVVKNNTHKKVKGLGFKLLMYVDPGQQAGATTTRIAPGINEFDGNIFVDCDGTPLPSDAYNAVPPSPSGVAATMGNPDSNMEFDIAREAFLGGTNCPTGQEDTCFVDYMQNVWPNSDNIAGATATEAGLNWALRPKPGSPAIPRKAGAFTPVFYTGPRTGDWQVTKTDFTGSNGFRRAFYLSSQGNLSASLKNIHDVDGDNLVEWYDFDNTQDGGFLQACIDCNDDLDNNGINDLEDILNGDLQGQNLDRDDNAVLDSHQSCFIAQPLQLEPNHVVMNRYLSFGSGNPDEMVAVRLTRDDGQTRYIQGLRQVSELSSQNGSTPAPTFTFANLGCEPFFQVLGANPIYVGGEEIIPGRNYQSQAIIEGCLLDEGNFSAPLTISTVTKWGDVAGPFQNGAYTSPDGRVDIAPDVLAILDKFSNKPTAPSKTRADIEPRIPDQKINITDISRDLDAFRGLPYPFTGADPNECP